LRCNPHSQNQSSSAMFINIKNLCLLNNSGAGLDVSDGHPGHWIQP
jgi:hypothetical protein